MVEQPKKTLTFCAMQYGIYMGVYLFMTFLFSVWSRYASIFNTLGALLLIATPAAVYLIMSHFVRRQGWPCRFVILWLLGICVFFSLRLSADWESMCIASISIPILFLSRSMPC